MSFTAMVNFSSKVEMTVRVRCACIQWSAAHALCCQTAVKLVHVMNVLARMCSVLSNAYDNVILSHNTEVLLAIQPKGANMKSCPCSVMHHHSAMCLLCLGVDYDTLMLICHVPVLRHACLCHALKLSVIQSCCTRYCQQDDLLTLFNRLFPEHAALSAPEASYPFHSKNACLSAHKL